MKDFITLQEHYCPFMQRNIVLEKTVGGLNGQDTEEEIHFCLYSRDCHCGECCQNRLLKVKILMKE